MKGYIIKETVGNDVWYHAFPLKRLNNVDKSLSLSTLEIDDAEIWFFVEDANFVCFNIMKYNPELNPRVVEVNLRIDDVESS